MKWLLKCRWNLCCRVALRSHHTLVWTLLGLLVIILITVQLIVINGHAQMLLPVALAQAMNMLGEFQAANIDGSSLCRLQSNYTESPLILGMLQSSLPPFVNRPKPGIRFVHNLADDPMIYFSCHGSHLCFHPGGAWQNNTCQCANGWWGKYCGLPEVLRQDKTIRWRNVKPRNVPRRIIYAVPFNNELDITEIKLHELGEVVDVFLFGESNFSSHGDAKPLHLLSALKRGFLNKYQNKILYVPLRYFDEKGYVDGWVAEALHRNNLGERGLKMQLFGAKPDDLFILTDADEIPQKEILLFLKNHDGFPEPFGFTLSVHVYGFYWTGGISFIYGGCTMDMVRNILDYEVYFLRNPADLIFKESIINERLWPYMKSANTTIVTLWTIGEKETAVGWHCTYCTKPEGIRTKLISAQNGDFPRWGDIPEKLDLNYIRTLILLGSAFDEQTKLVETPIDEGYLPKYVLENRHRFVHLVDKSVYGEPAFSLPRQKARHVNKSTIMDVPITSKVQTVKGESVNKKGIH